MKFRFCGDGDCPDWVLAEIISTLSIFSKESLEALSAKVAKRIVDEDFEEEEIKKLTSSTSDEGKSAVACLHFLLLNATRHTVSANVFNEELQQLGLPKDHAEALCRVLNKYMERIRLKLIEKSFKINELSSVKYIPTITTETNTIDCAKFEIGISSEIVDGLPENTKHVFNIDRGNLNALLTELKAARNLMETYRTENMANEV